MIKVDDMCFIKKHKKHKNPGEGYKTFAGIFALFPEAGLTYPSAVSEDHPDGWPWW